MKSNWSDGLGKAATGQKLPVTLICANYSYAHVHDWKRSQPHKISKLCELNTDDDFERENLMNFQEFKKATQRFNVLKRSDVAGSYHFGTATVSPDSLESRDLHETIPIRSVLAARGKLSGPQYEALAKILPLAAHEYTHFIDSTSTVWGMKFLSRMNAAYSCGDQYQHDEAEFWNAKSFYDFLKSIALPEYYTVKQRAQSTLPWSTTITAGQLFDKNGRITDRTILFQRFRNSKGEELVRSPISGVSILEASAMAQEVTFRMSLLAGAVDEYALIERASTSRDLAAYLYNPDLTEYSVCVHLVANVLRTPDIGSAFVVCSILTRVCLNLTDEVFDALAADEDLMHRVNLPDQHDFSRRLLDGLRLRDMGTVFFLLTRCLPNYPELTQGGSETVAMGAIEALGIDVSSIHADAITFAECVGQELRGSEIEPIRCLYEAGLNNLREINPLSPRLNFSRLHLPLALLSDSTEHFVLGDPQSPLAQRTIDSIYEPLIEGELWVERFSEGCF